MLFQNIFILLCFSFGTICSSRDLTRRNGVIGNVPYMALIRQPGDPLYRCGAAIISKRNLLTVASCIKEEEVVYEYHIDDYSNNIRTVIIHPEYKQGSLVNDIALMEQDYDAFKINQIIPLANVNLENNGVIYHRFEPNSIAIKTFKMTYKDCQNKFLGKSCASCIQNKCNLCEATSGELLVQNGKLVGIVSRLSTCNVPSQLISFTNVTAFVKFAKTPIRYLNDAKKKDKKKDTKKDKKKGKSDAGDSYVQVRQKGKKDTMCGGVMISEKHFLTAADCMNDKTKYEALVGRTGKPLDVKKHVNMKPKKKSIIAEMIKLAWLAVKKMLKLFGFKLPKLPFISKLFGKGNEGKTADVVEPKGKTKEEMERDFIHHNVPVFTDTCKKYGLADLFPVCITNKKRNDPPCQLTPGSPVFINQDLFGIVPKLPGSACKKKKAMPILPIGNVLDDIMKLTKNLKS